MNPIAMFENPAMAEQQMLYQLQMEQPQFWYQFQARPPSNDWERQQAIGALMQRYGHLSVLQGDAMFLNSQGYGRLLMAVNQELNTILATRDQYVNAMQSQQPLPAAPPLPAAQSPPAAPQPPPAAPAPSGGGDVREWLARSSAKQDEIRRRMVGDCIHCGKPLEGRALCPHCGRYQ
jgi:hypothetical protein